LDSAVGPWRTRRAHRPDHRAPSAVAGSATKQFFAPLASQNGEPADTMANWMFAQNCRHDVAQTTLRKFGVKVG
jgi:hypothetical protein